MIDPPACAGPSPHGILVVDKPAGKTSHDIVAVIRRASCARRVGHAGTLDPLATGVLVVCLGNATRVIEEIRSSTKEYGAVVRLGTATSTYDAEGVVTERRDVPVFDLDHLERALDPFRGRIRQVPPMYSAVRHEGRRLYALARAGREVEREAREVTVHALSIRGWDPPDLSLDLAVSAGTYVRSIAHDLGQALGVGAHLAALRRLAVGRFRLDEARSLPEVVDALEHGWWPLLAHPLDAALLDYPALVVDPTTESDIAHGRGFRTTASHPEPTGLVRAYGADGRFLALVGWDPSDGLWRPKRVFPA